ncbi:hypothetical protein HYT91_03420 [Candidatus Pacearchaeota archaeon]|nr:hypothetical protein [Candidatus Pacearchaeota archaeon]
MLSPADITIVEGEKPPAAIVIVDVFGSDITGSESGLFSGVSFTEGISFIVSEVIASAKGGEDLFFQVYFLLQMLLKQARRLL